MSPLRVYIETTFISYLAARPSNDVITAANQRISHDWWLSQRHHFELFVSPSIIEEITRGNPEASASRMLYADEATELELTEAVEQLANVLVAKGGLPKKALIDAYHVAFAAVWNIEFLLTWNCTHIANAITRPLIESLCKEAGFNAPRLCTPAELFMPQEE